MLPIVLARDVTVERTALFWRLALYLLFGSTLALASIVFDYAKVRAVVAGYIASASAPRLEPPVVERLLAPESRL